MKLTKYKKLQRKLARRHIRSRELTDTKPLATGGRIHIWKGRVHKGAGFEGRGSSVSHKVRDMVDMYVLS